MSAASDLIAALSAAVPVALLANASMRLSALFSRTALAFLSRPRGVLPFPANAFQVAFTMNPQPDTIILLTDGVFDRSIIPSIIQAATKGEKKIKIDTIGYVDQSGQRDLEEIAKATRGTYVYIAGP